MQENEEYATACMQNRKISFTIQKKIAIATFFNMRVDEIDFDKTRNTQYHAPCMRRICTEKVLGNETIREVPNDKSDSVTPASKLLQLAQIALDSGQQSVYDNLIQQAMNTI